MSTLAQDRRQPASGRFRPLTPRMQVLWAIYGLLGVLLFAYLVSLLARSDTQNSVWIDGWGICAIELVASGLCLAHGAFKKSGRAVALSLGGAILSWTIGDIVLTAESLGGATPPTPSAADFFYLLFYPLAYTALLLFMRGNLRRLEVASWLDGGIAGLGAGAACAAFAFQSILMSTGDSPAATITNLAYPIGDVLLLGLVVGGLAVLSGRGRAPWVLLAGGMALNVVGDTSNLFQTSLGASRFGVILNAVAWPTAIVLMSTAVWVRRRPAHLLILSRESSFILPNLGAAAALVVLVAGTQHPVGRVAIVLSTVTLIVVAVRLALSVHAMRAVSEERHRQSITDELTGLHNRRQLYRVLDAFFTEQTEVSRGRSLAFLFVDLNHFKEINDSFGHPSGDDLLRQLADRLRQSVRDTDLLVRLGGDEFAVVLLDGAVEYATTVAERLTSVLREPFLLKAVSAHLGASIGIAVAPQDGNTPTSLMACADVAMYRAKLSNIPYAFYDEGLDVDRDRMRLLEELRVAIHDKQLVLHYQPQLDLRTGQVLAAEALLRWSHPRLGLLPPAKFLPLAEEAGDMMAITRWVLDEAASQCSAWRVAGRPITVAVNVSPSTLLAPTFVEMVRDQLEKHALPGSALVLEITENCVITDFERAHAVITKLRELGVVLSVDDFGAGATSLAYLSNLSVGELKLDRTFISGLTSAANRDLDLVKSTIELGHAIGLRIVAEGIEDRETLELLTSLGCDLAQGYGISKPKPASQLGFRFEVKRASEEADYLEDLQASA